MARKMEKITDQFTNMNDQASASAGGAQKMKQHNSENMDMEVVGGFNFRPASSLNVANVISDVTNDMKKLTMSQPEPDHSHSLRMSESNEPCTSRSLLYNNLRTQNDYKNHSNQVRRDVENRSNVRDYEPYRSSSSRSSQMYNQQDGERKLSRKEREWLAEGKTLEPILTVFGPNHFKFYDTGYQGQGPLIELEDNEGFVSGLREGEEIPKRQLTPLELTLLRERKAEQE